MFPYLKCWFQVIRMQILRYYIWLSFNTHRKTLQGRARILPGTACNCPSQWRFSCCIETKKLQLIRPEAPASPRPNLSDMPDDNPPWDPSEKNGKTRGSRGVSNDDLNWLMLIWSKRHYICICILMYILWYTYNLCSAVLAIWVSSFFFHRSAMQLL